MKQMWKKLFTPTDMTEGTPWKKDCPVYDSDVDRKYCAAIIQYGG